MGLLAITSVFAIRVPRLRSIFRTHITKKRAYATSHNKYAPLSKHSWLQDSSFYCNSICLKGKNLQVYVVTASGLQGAESPDYLLSFPRERDCVVSQ